MLWREIVSKTLRWGVILAEAMEPLPKLFRLGDRWDVGEEVEADKTRGRR